MIGKHLISLTLAQLRLPVKVEFDE